jgi:hypothetical protein
MQHGKPRRRGDNRQRRGGNGEQQPLSNESSLSFEQRKKRSNSKRSRPPFDRVPPQAIDPNYVPGQNPQFRNQWDEQQPESSFPDDRQPRTNDSYGLRRSSDGNNRRPSQRGRTSGSQRSGQQRRDDGRPQRRDDGRPPRREGQQFREDGRPPRREDGRPPRREDGRPPRREDGRPPRREGQQSREGGRPPRRDGQQRRNGPPSSSARKGRGLGLAKKQQSKAPGRSKVYTSDMFLYKENLDPTKPSERKMRSRRNRPSDSSED